MNAVFFAIEDAVGEWLKRLGKEAKTSDLTKLL
jgi:hypothetical protein